MQYSRCHNQDTFHLKQLLMLTYGLMYAFSGRDTLRPLGI